MEVLVVTIIAVATLGGVVSKIIPDGVVQKIGDKIF